MDVSIDKKELAIKIKDESFVNDVTKKYFTYYDLNTNRFLEKNELLNIMKDISRTYFRCQPEKDALEFQFSKLDKDKNNKLDIGEFKPFIREYLQMLLDM